MSRLIGWLGLQYGSPERRCVTLACRGPRLVANGVCTGACTMRERLGPAFGFASLHSSSLRLSGMRAQLSLSVDSLSYLCR